MPTRQVPEAPCPACGSVLGGYSAKNQTADKKPSQAPIRSNPTKATTKSKKK